MSRWVEVDLFPENPTARNKRRNWRFQGEITLSMSLTLDPGYPRFEVSRILEDEAAVMLLENFDEIEIALQDLAKGKNRISSPYWEGRTPNAVRSFCRENRLPTPEGYAKAWRAMDRASRSRQRTSP
jgi:hypothetical protein